MTASTLHIAIIMDGNGRWAQRRGLSRSAGHSAGVEAARQVIAAAPGLGIRTLTLYALSSDNWQRPEPEVQYLLRLLRDYLRAETKRCVEAGIRVRLLGRRDRLPLPMLATLELAEKSTANGANLDLRLAIDYSSRQALIEAARSGAEGPLTDVPDVDLLIRTGGDQRLSDFLLWECAYAELLFLDTMWPEFSPAGLARALEEFRGRERRFGQLSRRAS